MPVFRELWGWAVFAVLAIASLLIVAFDTEWSGFYDFVIAVGHKVEPLWVSSAILVYTGAEGYAMLAKAFDRKLRAKYMAEGEAEGKAKGEAQTLSAVQRAAERRGMSPEDIEGVIDEAREIVRNGQGRQG